MPTGMFPGKGQKLFLASSNAEEPAWQSGVYPSAGNPTIPDGSKTMGIAVNPGLTTTVSALYGTAPSGTAFNVMFDLNKDFSTEYVYQAVASVASQKVYTWSTATELTGFIRVANAGGQSITGAWAQQRARTDG